MPVVAFDKDLNEEQLAAVQAPDGPVLVIAAAGTGKTRTLTYRVAWLVEQGIDPQRILLLTFTNKAAREMLERAQVLVGAAVRRTVGRDLPPHGQPHPAPPRRRAGLQE